MTAAEMEARELALAARWHRELDNQGRSTRAPREERVSARSWWDAPSSGGAVEHGAAPRFPRASDLIDMEAVYRWVYDGTPDEPRVYDQEAPPEEWRARPSAGAVLFAIGVGLLVAGAVIGVVCYRLGELGAEGWL